MTEKFSNSESKGQKYVDVNYGEAPEGIDATVYEQMKAAVADFIDLKKTLMECYDTLYVLVNPTPESGIDAPNEATKAVIQHELDLIWASSW